MGDEYRSALSAAQHRIDVLERELQTARANMPPPPKGTPAWVTLLATFGGLGVGLFVLGIGALVVSTVTTPRYVSSAPTDDPPAPAPEYKPLLGASWYTGMNEGPQVLVDVNGDGKKDVVSLFWRAPEDTALYVAAVDRETLESIWTAGPYPSQWSGPHTHLVVTADHVLVTDSREKLHVLDVKTGNSVLDLPFAGGARSACALATKPGLIRLDRSYDEIEILDPATGLIRPAPHHQGYECVDERVECKHAQPHQRCIVEDSTATARAKVRGFSAYYSSIVQDDLRYTEGSVLLGKGQHAPWLMMSDAKGRDVLWTSPAVREDETSHIAGRVSSELTEKAVITFYQRSTGDFRLLARANTNGAALWSTTVTGTSEGSFAELYVRDGEIFVYADHRMHVYDLDDGSERRVSNGI